LSSWKRGDKVSAVSFRKGLSQFISPSSFCKCFKVFKLSFLISTFWGQMKCPLITCLKCWKGVIFPRQCTIPRPQGPL
jgi:hypothetical protein